MRKSKLRAWHIVNKELLSSDVISQYITIINGEIIVPTNVILSWWTGLKDRNEKDIYEGDILGWDNKTDDPDSTIDPIRFEDGRFSDGLDSLCDLDLDSMEVIGNIHEKTKESANTL